jgi:hypothetical protein
MEKVPYHKVKHGIKSVIMGTISQPEPDNGLLMMAIHNLAAVNYIEMLDFTEHNEAVSDMHGQLIKIEV